MDLKLAPDPDMQKWKDAALRLLGFSASLWDLPTRDAGTHGPATVQASNTAPSGTPPTSVPVSGVGDHDAPAPASQFSYAFRSESLPRRSAPMLSSRYFDPQQDP